MEWNLGTKSIQFMRSIVKYINQIVEKYIEEKSSKLCGMQCNEYCF